MTEGLVIAGGLLGGAQVGDGPTDEQLNVLQGLLHGYLGIDADVTTVEPLSAEELAARVDPEHRKRVVDLLVVVEFCRHSDGEAQADRAEAYARALGVDEPLVQVARDALTDCQQIVMADWSRFSEAIQVEPQAPVADAALAQRLRSLASCRRAASAAPTSTSTRGGTSRSPARRAAGRPRSSRTTSATSSRGTTPIPRARSRCRRCSPPRPGSSTTSPG